MRKKDDTLRDTLLNLSREIADTEGIEAVNIRSIAGRAGVATGTVYNYFSNKDEILLALTEEYWKQTLTEMRSAVTADSFCGQVREIFCFLKASGDGMAGTHGFHAGRTGDGFRVPHGTGPGHPLGCVE